MNKPLKGVKVVDLTYFVAGPGAAKILADWGADVIKVEPSFGDPLRNSGPQLSMPAVADCNPLFSTYNANKRGLSVNLKDPEGIEAMYKLLSEANVFVSSYRTQALERLGLGYEDLHEKFPHLIWAQINGFGDDGPSKDEPGFDTVAFWARSGSMLDLAERGTTIVPPFGFGDSATAATLAGGICAALYEQQATGKGQKVMISLLANAIWSLSSIVGSTQYGEEYPKSRTEALTPVINNYLCADGKWICLTILDYDRYKEPLFKLLEIEEYLDDPRFANQEIAKENGKALIEIFDSGFKKFTRDEVVKKLIAADIAHGKVQSVKELPTDPQVLANNYLIKTTNRDGSEFFMPMTPIRFNTTEIERGPDAPFVGEHNDEILKELGYSEEKIAELREKKAIV